MAFTDFGIGSLIELIKMPKTTRMRDVLSRLRRMRGKKIGDLDIERGRNLVQRLQRRVGRGNFQRADQGLTHLRLVGEIVLRPRPLNANLPQVACKQLFRVDRISPPHPSG